MKRLGKKQVIRIHSILIRQTGGSDGIRDQGLLDSALNAPFQTFDNEFDIKYATTDTIYNQPDISFIHIARSGAWTPPWLDYSFFELIDTFDKPYKVLGLTHRQWDPENILLADIFHNII